MTKWTNSTEHPDLVTLWKIVYTDDRVVLERNNLNSKISSLLDTLKARDAFKGQGQGRANQISIDDT